MSGEVLRALAEAGPAAQWVLTLYAGVITTFTVYLGIVMIAAITTGDEKRREVCYRIFHDLVEFFREALFRRGGRR
jgi:hypothetical protein